MRVVDNVYCNRCDSQVYKEEDENLKEEYPYYCETCDENLYEVETWGYVPF